MSISSIPHDESSSEQWRDIPGYEGVYQASNLGNVKSTQRDIKTTKLTTGYYHVYLNGGIFLLHRLVMLAFVGECPEGHEVNHKNGNPGDNRLENLEYVTHSENIQHSYTVLGNKAARGQDHYMTRLSNDDVISIRDALNRGVKGVSLAIKYGVSKQTICDIKHRRCWKHI